MINCTQFSLAILAIIATIQVPHQDDNPETVSFKVAPIDYGKVIERLDGSQVYSDSGIGLTIDELNEKEIGALRKTVNDIQRSIGMFAKEYEISLVFRAVGGEIDFRRCGPSVEEIRNDLTESLNKQVVYQNKVDLTHIVINHLEKTRQHAR